VTTALGPGEEFDAIRRMLERWGDLAVGIGDDAAIIDLPRGDRLVASVDSTVENRHFRSGWLTPREIGYRAVAAALSDLAAMAARPAGILVALSIP
jgi:thiamine-monophosphate kinase